MRLSKTYIKKFKMSFLYWQNKFGLTQYDVAFFQDKFKDNEESYAKIVIDEANKVASVILPFELNKLDAASDAGPESNGMHEAIHLLLSRLRWLGQERYIGGDDLREEDEAVVNRLVKVLSDARK